MKEDKKSQSATKKVEVKLEDENGSEDNKSEK